MSAYYSNQEMEDICCDILLYYWKCFYCETSLYGKIS